PYAAPEAQAVAALWQIWLGTLTPSEAHERLPFIAVHQPSINATDHILRANYDEPTREALLLRWHAVTTNSRQAWLSISKLRTFLTSRRSRLDHVDVWTDLDLPKPYPQLSETGRSHAVFPERPIVLKSLHIEHVRVIDDLHLEFAPPTENKGQWIVFLGTNGAGKTTLLRSLCLALRNTEELGIWPKGTWGSTWRTSGEKADPHIRVTIDGLGVYSTRLKNGDEKPEQTRPQTQPQFFPVFAYGCRRGSAVGGEVRALDLGTDSGPEIGTLFNELDRLVHAETWLKEWDADAAKAEHSKPIWEAIQIAMRKLLDIEDVFVRDRQVYIKEKNKREIHLSALSDGYLTTAGWFLDLLARWIEMCHRAKQDVRGDFMQTMRGLVLLDEIDLHLHPKWQLESMRRVKELLPQMSFIVTTHNALTLVGAKSDEIHILKLRDHKVVAERGRERPMFLTGGEIFTQYFEVDDIFPATVGRDLQRYAFLSGYAARSPEEERELGEIKKRLAAEEIVPTLEVVPRIEDEVAEAAPAAPKRARRRKPS
ncbi:MAG TPA: AAA family ATPase, partial [Polyangium sp.]|nr:AAA family ATPase [Polyangium sp.]